MPHPRANARAHARRHTGTGIKGYDLSGGAPVYNPPVAQGPRGGVVEAEAAP